LADPQDALGRRARELLPASTGLSPEGIELALTRCLETQPFDEELTALASGVPLAPRAHVLLASNVFTAAHRAIALALAQSPRVDVRTSRREPEMAELLREASGGAFRVVEELAPSPGDHVWAYGSDETLALLRGELPAGVVYHAHGHGFGIAVVDAELELAAAARALADDVVPFDQRGCLSPRVAFVLGSAGATREFAGALARALAELGHDVPRGPLGPEETADVVRYRDTMLYAAEVLPAGKGQIGLDVVGTHVLIPPVGRNVHVVRTEELGAALGELSASIAAVGISGPEELHRQLATLLPKARISRLGLMQRPRFDGPVDLRTPAGGEVL
jgi:hypothetical protein